MQCEMSLDPASDELCAGQLLRSSLAQNVPALHKAHVLPDAYTKLDAMSNPHMSLAAAVEDMVACTTDLENRNADSHVVTLVASWQAAIMTRIFSAMSCCIKV